jgi:hypothetical protein
MEAQELEMLDRIRQAQERAATALERIAGVLASCRGTAMDGEGFFKVVVGDTAAPMTGPDVKGMRLNPSPDPGPYPEPKRNK